MPPASSHPGPDDVRVAHASADDLLSQPGIEARARAVLTDPDRERLDRLHRESDRRMFLVGRLMARTLVAGALGCGPLDWTWREGARGRPEVARPPTSLRFNLAHSAGLVACAVALDRDVGVDVEDLDRRHPGPDIVDRYCSPAEADDIRSQGDAWPRRFLQYWTLKEAYLKARGLGIAVPLAEVSFTLHGDTSARIGFLGSLEGADTAWSFVLAQPTRRHLVAVAASTVDGRPPSVSIDRFEPPGSEHDALSPALVW